MPNLNPKENASLKIRFGFSLRNVCKEMNVHFCRGINERILTVPNGTIGLLGKPYQGKEVVDLSLNSNMN